VRPGFLPPILCAAAFALLLPACSAQRPPDSGPSAAAVDLVWPPPPATARIRFDGSISGPRDLGIRKSLFGRIKDKLTGGSEVSFVRPSGVAERDGVVYVADPGARSVWILDPTNNRVTRVHRVGDIDLVSPVAVAVRADGAVFVADSVLARVFLIDRKGKDLGIGILTGLQRPAGLAYDDGGTRLYVADSAGQRILVYGAGGEELFAWGKRGNGEGEFNYPTHLALGHDGELLVTDALNFRIQSFDRQGRFLWQFGQQGDGSGYFASPKGIAVDSGQHVYVVDALFDAVQLFAQDGAFLMSFGSRGSDPGQFWLPGGLFIDDQDRILVADAYNHRIQRFRFAGTAQTPVERQK